MRRDAPSYIIRKADEDLYRSLYVGDFCYVLTSRQMGKSSLMVRTAARLRREGAVVAILDQSGMGQNVGLEQWYNNMLYQLGDRLGMGDELEEFQETFKQLGPLQLWIEAIRKVVLGKFEGKRVVIFIDEIDALRSLPFSTDEFFAGIRELYNRRAEDPRLERLTFCLLGVAAPPDLIKNPQTTPFNIGTRVELTDFTEDEATPLAAGLGRGEELNQRLLKRILYWTNGQPYLTQRLCLEIAEDPSVKSPKDVDHLATSLFLVTKRTQDRDINLLFVEKLMLDEPDRPGILTLYAQVHRKRMVRDDDKNSLVVLLRLSGIVLSVDGYLVVRNRIYHQAFDKKWIETHMPGAEIRRQQTAYRRGLLRAAMLSAVILLVIGSLAYVAYKGRKEAEQQKARAEGESERARQQTLVAEQEREEARRQASYAEEQSQLAAERLVEANKQKEIAEAERTRAEKQRQHAVEAARREEAARLEAEERESTEKLYREGTALFIGGDSDAAISKFNNALPSYEKLGDKPAQAITLVNIGAAYAARSPYRTREEAIRAYQKALGVYRSIPDHLGVANTQTAIGAMQKDTDPEESFKAYQEASRVYHENNDPANEAKALIGLGQTVSHLRGARSMSGPTPPKPSESGLDYFLKAISLSKDPSLLAPTHEQTAEIYKAVGDLRKAREHYEEALSNYDRLNNTSEFYKAFTHLVDIDLELKEPGEALKHYDKVSFVSEPYISGDWLGSTLKKISALYKESGEEFNAFEYLNKQAARYRQEGDSAKAINTLVNLGFLYLAAGDREKATDTLNRAASDYLKDHNDDGEDADNFDFFLSRSDALERISTMFKETGYDQQAVEYFNELAAKCRRDGNYLGQVTVLHLLGKFYRDTRGDEQGAFEYDAQAVLASLQAGRTTRLSAIGTSSSRVEHITDPKVYQRRINYFTQRAADYEAKGDYSKQALFLRVLGGMRANKDKMEGVIFYEKAISAYRQAKDLIGEAETLSEIAALSEREKKLDLYQKVLVTYQAANDPTGEAETLSKIAALTTEEKKKLNLYENALAAYHLANNNEGAAKTLLAMANIYIKPLDIDKSSAFLEQAALTYLKINKRASATVILMGAGDLYVKLKGAEQKAHDFYNRASEIIEAIADNTKGKAALLQRMGDAYIKVDKPKGLEYYKKALLIYRGSQMSEGLGYYFRRIEEVKILTDIGDIYRDLKEATNSIQAYEEVLRLNEGLAESKYSRYDSNSLSSKKAALYNKIGFVHLEVNSDERTALDYFNKALSLVRGEAVDPKEEAAALRNIGAAYRKSDKRKALKYYSQALVLFKSYDDIENIAETLKGISEIERAMGNLRKADDLKKQADDLKKQADDLKKQADDNDSTL